MSVKGFKLISGEEVIGRVDENLSTEDKYVVERPRLIIPQQMGNQLTIVLVPWAISAGEDATIEIKASAITSQFAPITEIERDYVKQTTGIQLVTG